MHLGNSVIICHTCHKGEIPNDIAALKGLRLVVCSEVNENQYWNESLVKDLTGGDTITARFLHKKFFSFHPEFKLFVYGNHKPNLRGTDLGIKRRIKLIPFTVTFDGKKDKAQIKRELNNELSGILNWALEGLRNLNKESFDEPNTVKHATEQYFLENDLIYDFLEEKCELGQNYQIEKGKLYSAYLEHCKKNAIKEISKNKFGGRMVEKGFNENRDKKANRIWLGVTLKNQ
ncbi:MAG: phage/plasmid primase, P4 family [Patescibacteria group bacterium]